MAREQIKTLDPLTFFRLEIAEKINTGSFDTASRTGFCCHSVYTVIKPLSECPETVAQSPHLDPPVDPLLQFRNGLKCALAAQADYTRGVPPYILRFAEAESALVEKGQKSQLTKLESLSHPFEIWKNYGVENGRRKKSPLGESSCWPCIRPHRV